MIKNIYAIALFLPFGAFLTAKESMQDFFNRKHQAIYTKLASKNISDEKTADFLNKSFNDLQPSLDTFLNEGGDINEFFIHPQDNSGHNLTILMYAAQNGYTDLVRYALDKGANPLLKNNQELTVFYYMCIKLIEASYWASVDTYKLAIDQAEIFGILLDAIEPQEHKQIFKPWVASFKYYISHSCDYKYDDMDSDDDNYADGENDCEMDFLKIWNTAGDNKQLIPFGTEALKLLEQIPSLKYCKVLQQFVTALDDSEKALLFPVLKEYCQMLAYSAHEDPKYIQDLDKLINMLN